MGEPTAPTDPEALETGTGFGLILADLNENGEEYLAVVHRVGPTYAWALKALVDARTALLGRKDRPYDVTEIEDERFNPGKIGESVFVASRDIPPPSYHRGESRELR